MSNDYGGTFITLTDENGEEVVLEYLDTVEYNGNIYMAFFPTLDEDVDPDEAEESEDYGLIIMRVETVNGEGDANVYSFAFTPASTLGEPNGTDGHPSAQTHARMAEELSGEIRRICGW